MKQSSLPVVYEYSPSPERVRQIMRHAGSHFGSVHFVKRSTGELRKMCYRLGVRKPSCAAVPGGGSTNRTAINKENTQMTVLDANKVIRDNDGHKVGRGAWRTVPLENVVEVSAGGTRYKMVR